MYVPLTLLLYVLMYVLLLLYVPPLLLYGPLTLRLLYVLMYVPLLLYVPACMCAHDTKLLLLPLLHCCVAHPHTYSSSTHGVPHSPRQMSSEWSDLYRHWQQVPDSARQGWELS